MYDGLFAYVHPTHPNSNHGSFKTSSVFWLFLTGKLAWHERHDGYDSRSVWGAWAVYDPSARMFHQFKGQFQLTIEAFFNITLEHTPDPESPTVLVWNSFHFGLWGMLLGVDIDILHIQLMYTYCFLLGWASGFTTNMLHTENAPSLHLKQKNLGCLWVPWKFLSLRSFKQVTFATPFFVAPKQVTVNPKIICQHILMGRFWLNLLDVVVLPSKIHIPLEHEQVCLGKDFRTKPAIVVV